MESPIALIVGTRPDAIKLVPVYRVLKQRNIPVILCATYQHRHLLDPVFSMFDVKPDVLFDVMQHNQNLSYLTGAILAQSSAFYKQYAPGLVFVQGDTTTSFAAALAAFYDRIPIAHVEAGIRTGDIFSPFPEEANRVFIGKISQFHFSPSPLATMHLLHEGASARDVFCVGNTVVDALRFVQKKIANYPELLDSVLQNNIAAAKSRGKRIVLLTTHRRESFNGGIEAIFSAIAACAQRCPDVLFIFPMHPNPHIRDAVGQSSLPLLDNVLCIQPLSYYDLVSILSACDVVMTDSGGIQEEAVTLGKSLIILRETTERIEVLWERAGVLVGTDYEAIVRAFDTWYGGGMQSHERFVYGDGAAADRIVDLITDKNNVLRDVVI